MTSYDIDCRDNAGNDGGGHNYILSLGGNTGSSCAYIGKLDSKFATVLVLLLVGWTLNLHLAS